MKKLVFTRQTGLLVLLAALALVAVPVIHVLASESKDESAKPSDATGQQILTETSNWDPIQDLIEMRRQMENLFTRDFDQYLVQPDVELSWDNATLAPQLDLRERDDAYIIHMDLPGMDKSAIHLNVDSQVLRVSGKRDRTTEEKVGDNVIRRERSHGAFERVVSLPGPVQTDQVSAVYKSGVLTVTLPKAEAETTSVAVAVK